MQPIQNQLTTDLMRQSFYFANKAMIETNARRFAMGLEESRAAEYLAKKHKRPTLLDKAKNYIQAVV